MPVDKLCSLVCSDNVVKMPFKATGNFQAKVSPTRIENWDRRLSKSFYETKSCGKDDLSKLIREDSARWSQKKKNGWVEMNEFNFRRNFKSDLNLKENKEFEGCWRNLFWCFSSLKICECSKSFYPERTYNVLDNSYWKSPEVKLEEIKPR
jgi:hypothetical protein